MCELIIIGNKAGPTDRTVLTDSECDKPQFEKYISVRKSLNILMVNYDYPPVGGIGTQRIFHFAKYLRMLGMNPIVLTTAHGLGRTQDLSATRDPAFEKIRVIRTGGIELIPHHTRELKGIKRLLYKARLALKYFWYGQVYYCWYQESVGSISDIVRQEKIDCVWTTSPSYASLFFGRYIRTELGLPWIVDLRDSMVDRISTSRNTTNFILKFIHRHWERKLLKEPDHIVCVSKPILDNVISRTGYQWISDRSTVIPNGFDPDDYADFDHQNRIGTQHPLLTVVYAGTLFGRRKPTTFMHALQLVKERNPNLVEKLDFVFAGLFDDEITQFLHEKLKGFRYRIPGFLERAEVIELQRHSDLLLLLTIEAPHKTANEILTGKVFEYMGAARPIFATAPKGPLEDLIHRGRFGATARPGDVEQIYEKFVGICNDLLSTGGRSFSPDQSVRNQYSRKHQVDELADIIQTICTRE